MTDIVLASNNRKKIAELESLLSASAVSDRIRLLSLGDIGFTGDIDEYGESFEENSIIKSSVPASLGYIGIADDSGLCVDALGGAPGIYSARYSGEHGDDASNRRRLMRELDGVPESGRSAFFVCAASIALPENSPFSIPEEYSASENVARAANASPSSVGVVRGECRGVILDEERGCGGFGYDPLFFSPELGKTFAEASAEEKNRISHRGRAMEKFVKLIELVIGSGA